MQEIEGLMDNSSSKDKSQKKHHQSERSQSEQSHIKNSQAEQRSTKQLLVFGSKSGNSEITQIEQRNRRFNLITLFVIFSLIVLFLALQLGKVALRNYSKIQEDMISRPELYDRNGRLIAGNHFIESVYANPNKIDNPKEYSKILVSVFPELKYYDILNKLKSGKNFIWIIKNISENQKFALLKHKLKYVEIRSDYARVYPYGSLFAHVIGYVNADNVAVMGFERWMDKNLLSHNHIASNNSTQNKTGQGNPSGNVGNENLEKIVLSLDVDVQDVLREQVTLGVNEFEAEWGCAMVVSIETGEVLGLFSYPDFDMSNITSANGKEMFNHVTSGLYEFGSIFKIFNLAFVIENSNDLYKKYDVSEDLRIGKFTVKDAKKFDGSLDIFEGFRISSNICNAKAALDIGGDLQKQFLTEIELFSKQFIEIVEVANAKIPSNWKKTTTVTVSYGYGVAVTAVHVMQALLNVISYRKPKLTLIKVNRRNAEGNKDNRDDGDIYENFEGISKKDSDNMANVVDFDHVRSGNSRSGSSSFGIIRNRITSKIRNHEKIRSVVVGLLNENMKGWYNPNISQHKFGGKTGTANILLNGVYVKKHNVVSFIGTFPEDPKYALIMVFGAPKPSARTFGMAYSILFTAPIARNIINILMNSVLKSYL